MARTSVPKCVSVGRLSRGGPASATSRAMTGSRSARIRAAAPKLGELMTFIMPQAAAAVTLPYRWPRSLAVRVGQGAREGDMSKRQLNGLAWTLLVLTVVMLAANVVLGWSGGVAWTAVFGFIPITLS